MATVVIKINTDYFTDPSRSGSWATQMRHILNELAFEAGDGSWEFERKGRKIDVYDPDEYSSVGVIGSVTIVPSERDFD